MVFFIQQIVEIPGSKLLMVLVEVHLLHHLQSVPNNYIYDGIEGMVMTLNR